MSNSFRPSKPLPALGYTQELGRRLENIRHYEPVTNLVPRGAGALERRRGGGVLASPATVKAEGYNGYFKIVHYVKYASEDDEVGHNYIFVVDGNSFSVSDFEESGYVDAGNDMPCGVTYSGYFWQSGQTRAFPSAYSKNYTVAPTHFDADAWDIGLRYIYLVFPYNEQPYLVAKAGIYASPLPTEVAYLIGTVHKTIESGTGKQQFTIVQRHQSGAVDVTSNQYIGMFKLVPTIVTQTIEPEEGEEGNGEPEEIQVPAIAVCEGHSWNGSTSGNSNCSVAYSSGGGTWQYSVPCELVATSEMAAGNNEVVLVFPYHSQPFVTVIPSGQNIVTSGVHYTIGAIGVDGSGSVVSMSQSHAIGAVSVTDGQYTGMFKIVDKRYMSGDNDDGGVAITLCDGASWDGATSGDSTCFVNNVAFAIPCMELDGEGVVYLHYEAKPFFAGNGGVGSPQVTVKIGAVLPSNDTYNAYYQIGRINSNGSITQNHTTGAVYIRWYLVCPED